MEAKYLEAVKRIKSRTLAGCDKSNSSSVWTGSQFAIVHAKSQYVVAMDQNEGRAWEIASRCLMNP